jgi:hypothetical protein
MRITQESLMNPEKVRTPPYPLKLRAVSGIAVLALCGFLAGLLVWKASPPGQTTASSGSSVQAVSYQPYAVHHQSIDHVRVGQRVLTPHTDLGRSTPTSVNPATWKLVTMRLISRWPDGTQDDTQIQTLQPPVWLQEQHVAVGARVAVPLDLEEMGVPDAPAEVLAIAPCPKIDDGPGRVVLTTVNHLNNFLFDLKVQGERAPPQALKVTGWHKLYSQDRQDWVSVCDLHEGEALQGHDGPLQVASLGRLPGTIRVYNLTVEDEHVYTCPISTSWPTMRDVHRPLLN